LPPEFLRGIYESENTPRVRRLLLGSGDSKGELKSFKSRKRSKESEPGNGLL